jgi:hypothetical protein
MDALDVINAPANPYLEQAIGSPAFELAKERFTAWSNDDRAAIIQLQKATQCNPLWAGDLAVALGLTIDDCLESVQKSLEIGDDPLPTIAAWWDFSTEDDRKAAFTMLAWAGCDPVLSADVLHEREGYLETCEWAIQAGQAMGEPVSPVLSTFEIAQKEVPEAIETVKPRFAGWTKDEHRHLLELLYLTDADPEQSGEVARILAEGNEEAARRHAAAVREGLADAFAEALGGVPLDPAPAREWWDAADPEERVAILSIAFWSDADPDALQEVVGGWTEDFAAAQALNAPA